MKEMMPENVREAIERLLACGHEAYAVGGCVRDLLMRRTPHDFDLCTDALPEQVIECFSGVRVLETGLSHGTVTVLLRGKPIEVTTYRVDGAYSDHRRPDRVTYTSRLEEDLARRDFTINAMAYRPDVGVVDPFGGEADIRAGIVRCVGDARTRFMEDTLRILRALRFASRFGFAIEEETARAMLDARATLCFVAKERVFAELSGMDFARIDERFLPVLQAVIPELSRLDVPPGLPGDAALRFAALLRGLDAEAILARLRASRALSERVALLVNALSMPAALGEADVRRVLSRMGPEAAEQLFLLQRNDGAMAAMRRVLARGDCYRLSMLALRGDDLRALGLSGPAIGKALNGLLERVIDGADENTREALLGVLRSDASLRFSDS